MLTNDFSRFLVYVIVIHASIFATKHGYAIFFTREFNNVRKTKHVIIRYVISMNFFLVIHEFPIFVVPVKTYNIIFVCYSIKLVIYHISLFLCHVWHFLFVVG